MAAEYVAFGKEDPTSYLKPVVLPDDDDDSSVDENYEVASITSSIEDQLTWRGRLQRTLHGVPFQIFILSLVVLDAFIVLFELLLDVGAFQNIECSGKFIEEEAINCHYKASTRAYCPPSPSILNNSTNLTAGNGTDFCRCVFRSGKSVCGRVSEDRGVDPAYVLHVMSIVILAVFLLEILIKLIAFRFKYFTHKFEVFDGMVVIISFILDIASITKEETFASAAGLIIILRLWRVVRIVNGAVLSAKTRSDDQLHKARTAAREVIHALHKAQDKLTLEEKAYSQLKDILDRHQIEVPEKPGTIPQYPYDQEENITF